MRFHGMYRAILLTAGALALSQCTVSSTFERVDVGGSLVLVDPVNVPSSADGSSAVSLLVRRNSGQALVGVAVAIEAPSCTVVPPFARTDGRGQIQATLTGCTDGTHVVRARLAQGELNTPLPSQASINFYPVRVGSTDLPAGTPLDQQVVVRGSDGLPNITYAGTISFASSDPAAKLPPPVTLTPADHGVFNTVGTIVLVTPGLQTLTAIDSATGTVLFTTSLQVAATALADDALSLSLGGGLVAGVPQSLSLTALTPNQVADARAVGAISLSSSDPRAVLPANQALFPGDGGRKTLTGLIFSTAGPQQLEVSLGGLTAIVPVNVAPGPARRLQLTGPATVTAGVPSALVLTARDAYDNRATGYVGSVNVRSSDAQASPASQLAVLDASAAGLANLALTLKTAGRQTVSVSDARNPSLNGTSGPIQVAPGAVSQLAFAVPASVTAGQAITPAALRAEDAYHNLVPTWATDVALSSDDPAATGPTTLAGSSASGGLQAIAGLVLRTAGNVNLHASAAGGGLQTSQMVTVLPGPAASLRVLAPTSAIASTTEILDLSVWDAQGNLVDGYTGTLGFTSSDAAAFLPAPTPFTADMGGQLSFGTLFQTAGPQLLTIAQAGVAPLSTTIPLNVLAGPADHVAISAPVSASAGIALAHLGLTVQDAFGNVALPFTGRLNLTHDAVNASVPAQVTLGAAQQGQTDLANVVQFRQAARITLSVADNAGALRPAQQQIQVNAGPPAQLRVTAPANAVTATPTAVDISVVDGQGNLVTDYRGTVRLSSSDTGAAPASDLVFDAAAQGHLQGTYTFANVGSMVVRAVDTSSGSLTGNSVAVAVTGLPVALQMGLPAGATAGTAIGLTLTALDANGLTAPSYTGTVSLSNSDLNASTPAGVQISSGGTVTLANAIIFHLAGSQKITATDVTYKVPPTSRSVLVQPGPLASLVLGNLPNPSPLGQAQYFTATAFDTYANLATTYRGTLQFSSSNTAHSLPANYTFTASDSGQATIRPGITFNAMGTQGFTATSTAGAVVASITTLVHQAVAITGHNSASQHCVVFDDGQLKCWGSNTVAPGNLGNLGLGDTLDRGAQPSDMGRNLPAVNLGSGRRVVSAANTEEATCAVLDDGTAKCFGKGNYGILGQGDGNNHGDTPQSMGDNLLAIDLGTGRTALAVATSGFWQFLLGQSCALLDTHQVKCWGSNFQGGLGLGDTMNRGNAPGDMGDALPAVNLGTGRKAKAVDGGIFSTCVILDTNQVKCWGMNSGNGAIFPAGTLGVGDTTDRGSRSGQMGDSLPIVALGAGRSAVALGTGAAHRCAILDDASLKCWGNNGDGQLGLGDTLLRGATATQMGDGLPAVNLGSNRTAKQVVGGSFHTCAILDTHAVKCWGKNVNGELGLGDTSPRGSSAGQMGDALPVVDLGSNRTALQLAAGHNNTCVLLDNRQVKCWGSNSGKIYGYLGIGDNVGRGGSANQMGDNLPVVLW